MRLTFLFLFIVCNSLAQTYSSNTAADIEEIQKSYIKNHNRVSPEMYARYPINQINGVDYVSFLGKVSPNFDLNDFTERGINIGSQIKDIVSIRYPLNQLNEILLESSFSYIKIAGKVKPLLDKVAVGTRVDSVWAGINLPQGYTGKDVIIGITDWGFDYTSPMFYDTLLVESRILAAWDQFKTSGPSPTGYTYGAEYSSFNDLQTAGSDTANFYSYATHGSHVAGIAGGSGAGLEFRGMAFESEFLFVTFRFDESFVLDAWQWLYDKATAEGKRLVINMSWGIYHMGALDGTDILEQALDAYTAQEVLFVTSAGNNGSVNFHIEKDFAADTIKTQVSFYSSTMPNLYGQSVHMWGEAGNEFSSQLVIADASNNILVSSPWYSTATTTSYIDSFLVASGADTVFFNLSADATYPSNNRPQTRLRIAKPPSGYKAGIRATAPNGKVHFWNLTELTDDVGNWGMAFTGLGSFSTSGNNQYGVGVPACANTALTVGAYASEHYAPSGALLGGGAASFSSNGPLMDGTEKPDVSAPGVAVASSISSFTDASFSTVASVDFNGRTYPFSKFSGTSMSSPACAGVAALVLDANPYLSAQQVKEILITTARQDNFTGVIPPHSPKWGWGKVNAYAAVQIALITTGIQDFQKDIEWTIYPNPTNEEISLNGVEGSVQSIEVLDLFGNIVIVTSASNKINVGALSNGTYFVKVIRDGKVEQKKFIKQ